MSTPGSNLLNEAFSLIAQETATFYGFTNRSVNENGYLETTYDAPVTLKGSFQPLSKSLYQAYGLDFTKSYYTFYVSYGVIDLGRATAPSLLVYNGLVYMCESDISWYSQDGWKGVLVTLCDLAVPS